MYKLVTQRNQNFGSNPVFEGERIENKVKRILNNKEPINDGAPILYTDKNELNPNYDHRTDRWEIATDNMSVVHKSEIVKSEPNATNNSNDINNSDTSLGSDSAND